VPRFGEGCRKVHGDGAFADAAFAAYDGDFVFDFAHAGFKQFHLLLYLQKSLFSSFYDVWGLVGCAHKRHLMFELDCLGSIKLD
jgi:hypothetical protein